MCYQPIPLSLQLPQSFPTSHPYLELLVLNTHLYFLVWIFFFMFCFTSCRCTVFTAQDECDLFLIKDIYITPRMWSSVADWSRAIWNLLIILIGTNRRVVWQRYLKPTNKTLQNVKRQTENTAICIKVRENLEKFWTRATLEPLANSPP